MRSAVRSCQALKSGHCQGADALLLLLSVCPAWDVRGLGAGAASRVYSSPSRWLCCLPSSLDGSLQLCDCTALTGLNLGNNAISALPAAIGDLASLRRLWVEDNCLGELPDVSSSPLPLRLLLPLPLPLPLQPLPFSAARMLPSVGVLPAVDCCSSLQTRAGDGLRRPASLSCATEWPHSGTRLPHPPRAGSVPA